MAAQLVRKGFHMWVPVEVDGEIVEKDADMPGSVRVVFPRENGVEETWECRECGEEFEEEEPNGRCEEQACQCDRSHDVRVVTVEDDDGDELEVWECSECGERFEEQPGVDEECEFNECTCDLGHECERVSVPLEWVNSAGIALDEEDDAVRLSISIGDPRGAFVFTVRRMVSGELVMHLPYPGMSFAHEELTELHPGTYRIGW